MLLTALQDRRYLFLEKSKRLSSIDQLRRWESPEPTSKMRVLDFIGNYFIFFFITYLHKITIYLSPLFFIFSPTSSGEISYNQLICSHVVLCCLSLPFKFQVTSSFRGSTVRDMIFLGLEDGDIFKFPLINFFLIASCPSTNAFLTLFL